MHIGHIELFVTDPLRSMAFYRDKLGFSVTTVQAEQFVWLQLGDQELLLRPGKTKSQSTTYDETNIGLVLYAVNFPEKMAELQAKGINFVPMSDSCAAFTDPDGHWFQLVDPNHD